MKSHHGSRRSLAGITVLTALALVTAACGSDDEGSTATPAPANTTAPAATAAPAPTDAATPTSAGGAVTTADDSAAWDQIVADAKKEGKVTIYSSQGVDQLNEMGKLFKDEYGIEVEVFRAIDSDLQAKIQAERDTGKPIADVVIQATAAWQVAKSDEGWFAVVDLPGFDNPDYNTELNVSDKGDYFVSTAAVLTFGWNTDLWPQGLKDYPDLLDPELKGKIGVIEPAAGSIVDFWLYLEEKYGEDFTDKLAAQDPRIYPSSLPMGEALISGEIAAGLFVQVQDPAKADGAPVDSALSDPVWGAIFNTAVLENAPHPNAALVLADFIISETGQRALAARAASSLPGIEGSVGITTDSVRRQDLSALTPDVITAYQARWAGLFT